MPSDDPKHNRANLLVVIHEDGRKYYLKGYDHGQHSSDVLWTGRRDEARVFKNEARARAAAEKYHANLETL